MGMFLYDIYWTFTSFLKNTNPFQNLDYRFLVESTKIENTIFPYKTALSEVNVKINRIGLQNSRVTKNKVYYFIFSKILFQFKNFV